jgi:AcrR family transcriptional regulator
MAANRGEQSRPGTMRRGLVEAEILEHAARLFSEHGYGATTLQDIAADLGTSRSSLYHYFSNKDEMLIRLVSDLVLSSEGALRRIRESAGEAATARLRLAIEALLHPIVEAPNRFRLLLTGEAQLPPEMGQQWLEIRRSIVAEVASLIREGTRRGEFRAVDEQAATFTVLGMCNWVAWWPERQREDEAALRTTIAELAVAGLSSQDRDRGSGSAQDALVAVRHELDRLESLIAPASS